MKKNKEKINKFLLGGVTATLVASAIVPVASADVGGTITKEVSADETVKDEVVKDEVVKEEVVKEEDTAVEPDGVLVTIENPFSDITESNTHYENILYAYENGFINGYNDGTFRPSETIKRVHTALIIARALGATPDGDYADAGFTDVPENYKWAVNFLYQEGIINGKSATNFGSYDTTTRGQMAKIIVNAYGLEADADVKDFPFNDVPKPSRDYVKALYDNGITLGTGATTFSPNADVTRGQLATFVVRAELNAETVVEEEETEEEVVVTPLEVKDVKILNSKEITVEFNESVTVSALDVKNYNLKVGATAVSNFKVEFVNDTTVLITLTDENKLVNGGAFVLGLTDKIISTEFSEGIEGGFSKTLIHEDVTGPTIKSVVKVGTDVVVTFDEFVTSADVIKIDGINIAIPTVEKESTKTLVLKNAGKTLFEGKHSIVLSGVSDNIGNKSTVLYSEFLVEKDLSAPGISTVEQKGDYVLEVSFNKAVQFVSGNKIKVYKNGFELTGTVNTTDNITYTITLSDNGGLKVYGDKEDNSVVTVLAEGYKSVVNDEIGTRVEKTVTLSKDRIIPVVDFTKNTVVNVGTADSSGVVATNEVLQVEFSENISLLGSAGDLIVTNKDGIKQTVNGVKVVTDTEGKTKVLQIDVTSIKDVNGKIKEGTYTIDLPSNFVSDTSGNKNVGTKFNFVVDYKESNATVVATGLTNTITLNYSDDMDISAINPLNYTVDGKPLGTDSKIYFNNDRKTVVIELPANFIKVSGGAIVNISESVKTSFGKSLNKNSLVQYISTGLVDNTAPTVLSAVKKSNNTIEVTLSEAIDDATLATNLADNDFIVQVNGVNFNYTVTTGTTANDNVIVITTTDTFNFNSLVTVDVTNVTGDITITDLSTLGNKLVKTQAIVAQ